MLGDFAARLIFQYAVRGRTWAGDRVVNQPLDPIDGLISREPTFGPLIAVYSTDSEFKVTGQDMTGGTPNLGLAVAIYCPQSANIDIDGTELNVKGSGGLAGFVLDTVAYQIRQALVSPTNKWGRLWAKFVPKISSFAIQPPYVEQGDKVRLGVRIMVIEFTPINDPTIGRPMTDTWKMLHDMMIEEPTLAPIAPILKSSIEDFEVDIPDWARVIMQLGLDDEAALNAGLRPLLVDDPLAAEIISGGGFYPEGGDPDTDTPITESEPAGVDPGSEVPPPDPEP